MPRCSSWWISGVVCTRTTQCKLAKFATWCCAKRVATSKKSLCSVNLTLTKIQAGVRSFQTRHSLQSDISSNRPNASINCSTMASRVRFDGKNDICERAATCPSPYASPGNVTAHFEQHGDIRHQPTMTSLNTRDAAPNTARTYPKSDVLPAQGDMLPVQEDMLPVQEDNTVARVKLKVLKRLNNLDTDGVRRVLRLDDLGFF
eukprot:GEMP01068916.1.p1 GENE.GEMP01068916.1~~GEMP01068916.1.p1  ORF type:complete len:203 (+),score=53.50 GEMP01068916.1:325-933(+)